MLQWSVVFLGIAATAAVFGFGDITVASAEVARVLAVTFFGLSIAVIVVRVAHSLK
ncbi:DUF1328 domain-containing protein [Sulfitobacter sp. D35]|uniref:DUF1328 domain-containing protein n=1 Tax=Sulfitobacter sp. D35 TaxID=3083252 RepID=UPI00296F36CB|nr:DUF1328 domain-containing protein [Sulfitobacter sp. D35]MDW4499901.1 DUF1328 domain-containing protein [Sulfitobacter sp. D35]